jgi:hypothetical protein
MLRLAEDDSAPAEGSASWGGQSALDLYPGLRRLQSGSHAKPGRRSSGDVTRSRSVSVRASLTLEAEATKTPEITPLDIVHDEKQKEKHAKHQFFRSLLFTWTGRAKIQLHLGSLCPT